MNKLRLSSRILIAIASLSLIACYFLPVWFIFLLAPQYPEGLTMNIWLTKLTGEVEIINGLNHYIGMKHIKVDMFPEFDYLIYIVGAYIAMGLVVAISGSKKLLSGYLVLLLIGAAAAMIDFYAWGYDYGHNLDPKAAIQVPGLFYQPPLLGHKKLLNFDAYSYPDSGGWVVVCAGLAFFAVWIREWFYSRKKNATVRPIPKTLIPTIAAVSILLFVSSCQVKAEPFNYGKDICDDCKMTIMDPRFGAEIITKKGKVYKFDDAHCIIHFLKSGRIKPTEIQQTVFVDFEHNGTFIDASTLHFVISPQLKSPMNSNAAAFSNQATAEKIASQASGQVKTWQTLMTGS